MDPKECAIHTAISSDYRNRHAEIYSSVHRQLFEIRWHGVDETVLTGLSVLPYVSIVAQQIKGALTLTGLTTKGHTDQLQAAETFFKNLRCFKQ
jgi:hypothetical protein